MKTAYEAMKALQFPNLMEAHLKSIKAMHFDDSMKVAQEAIKALQFQDPMEAYLKSIKAMHFDDSMKVAQEAIKALQFQDPLKQLRDAVKAAQRYSPLFEKNGAYSGLNFDSILKKISISEWPLAYAPINGRIEQNGDNTLTVDADILSCSEIQNIANEIAEKTFDDSSKQLESILTKLLAEIRGLKNPIFEKIISILIFPIIVALIFSVINPITDFHIKESLGAEKRELEKKIKKHVLAATEDITTLDAYRLVSKDFLHVRLNPSARSPILGRLKFGQVIVLVEKRNDWSLVSWSDNENGVAIQGWVFSRYLEKFR